MPALPVSPLAPASQPVLPRIAGVRLGGVAIGLKKNGGRDLMLAELAPGTTIAGALTRSLCSSAPVDWCRDALNGGKARAIVVNSGNSNAFTGKAGEGVGIARIDDDGPRLAAVERIAAPVDRRGRAQGAGQGAGDGRARRQL